MNEVENLEKIKEILGELTEKVDKLSKKVNMEEEDIVAESKMLDKLSKGLKDITDYLDGAKGHLLKFKGQSEDKISENPIAYILGAFVGGIILGNLIGRKK